jgi:hypothetical protein
MAARMKPRLREEVGLLARCAAPDFCMPAMSLEDKSWL